MTATLIAASGLAREFTVGGGFFQPRRVLHAVNGGGQNLARAMLTGALAGAQVGLKGIPARFIDGLVEADALRVVADRVAGQAAAG